MKNQFDNYKKRAISLLEYADEYDSDAEPGFLNEELRKIWNDGRIINCGEYTYIAKPMAEYKNEDDFLYEVENVHGIKLTIQSRLNVLPNIKIIEVWFNKKDGFFCHHTLTQPTNAWLLGPVFAIKTSLLGNA